MTASKSSGSIIITTLSRVMPALLTTMASGPSSFSARSTICADLLLVADVAHDDEALAPELLDLADDLGAGVLVGEVVDGHVGAGRGQASAISRPMPRPAPVTSATAAVSGQGLCSRILQVASVFSHLGERLERPRRLATVACGAMRRTRPHSTVPGPTSRNES